MTKENTIDARDLRTALGRFATGVTIIVAPGKDGPIAMTANSFASVSLDPALVLWSPARGSARHDAFCAAQTFTIYVLAKDQMDQSQHFATPDSTFDHPGWRINTAGLPVLDHYAARFDCAQHAVLDGGDHSIILGRVLNLDATDAAPLLFVGGKYAQAAPI